MRLFQAQTLTASADQTDIELDSKLKLLKQTSQLVKEKGNRVATPDKTAILELASNFEKWKLGKQQQMLTDMTKRCREQEVQDMSAKLTTKCDLLSAPRLASDTSFYMNKRIHPDRLSELTSESLIYAGTTVSEILPDDKSYKYFPARNKYRQQKKLKTDTDINGTITDSCQSGREKYSHKQTIPAHDYKHVIPPPNRASSPFRCHHRRKRIKYNRYAQPFFVQSTSASGLNCLFVGIKDDATSSTKHNGQRSNHQDKGHGMVNVQNSHWEKLGPSQNNFDEDKKALMTPVIPSMESIGRALVKGIDD